ncbi:MAG: methylated-DNA--[protein]-cysteine S-methyltransferase [Dehalococcoidia bacterium]
MRLEVTRVGSPVGLVMLVSDGPAIVALDWADCQDRMDGLLRSRYGPVELTAVADSPAAVLLRAYFAGDLCAIDAIAVDTAGTPFQRRVWAALRTIPVGTTVSYRDLAETIGSPRAVRAVGLANGSNPVSIVVPCHRVIGADGSMTGYAGGIERKRWLLAHEGARVQARLL